MGAWGSMLYQNDIGCDVKQEYLNKFKAGKTDEVALEEIYIAFYECLDDEDDKYDFWFALADTMWKNGRLVNEVKNIALELISEERTVDRWKNERDQTQRNTILDELKKQLLSEMPPRKKIPVHKPYITKWHPHDVYIYQIKNPPEGKEEYLGWYITIYVHDVGGHEFVVKGVYDMIPDIYIKVSKEKPKVVSKINDLPFICLLMNPNTGEGRFRITLSELSNRKYPKDLEYLGNCTDFRYPENEEIIEPFCDLVGWHSIEQVSIRSYENELKRQAIVEELKKKADE